MYEKLYDLNNLYGSYRKCRKGVSWKPSVQKYGINYLLNNNRTGNSLIKKTYRQKPFKKFDISERGKLRHIRALHFSDRIVQRSLCDEISSERINRHLVYDNGASMKKKGVDFSRRRIKVHLERYYRKHGRNGYVLQIDFSKYFDNIIHSALENEFGKYIDDADVMTLIGNLIASFGDGKSVGIGSQLSQVAGILYPNRIDGFIKTIKRCRYYGRYMDDLYIIHDDREFLERLLEEIRIICRDYGIIPNEKKTHITRLCDGFTFLKMRYVISESGKIAVIPKNDTFVAERRKLRKFRVKCDEGRMTLAAVKDQYYSWRGDKKKYKCRKRLMKMDELYKTLFWRKTA